MPPILVRLLAFVRSDRRGTGHLPNEDRPLERENSLRQFRSDSLAAYDFFFFFPMGERSFNIVPLDRLSRLDKFVTVRATANIGYSDEREGFLSISVITKDQRETRSSIGRLYEQRYEPKVPLIERLRAFPDSRL